MAFRVALKVLYAGPERFVECLQAVLWQCSEVRALFWSAEFRNPKTLNPKP